MKSSSQAEIINNILSPQDAGELFSRLLREYGVKNEAYFFKLICFYYFNIHVKKDLSDLKAIDSEQAEKAIIKWKQDILCLIGNYLVEGAIKSGHTTPDKIYGFIKSVAQSIMNIFQDEKELPKFCYNFATKLKSNWGKIHNTLMIKDELSRILPINSYSNIYNYVAKNHNFTQAAADIKLVDPRAFQQADISAYDTLQYFFEIDTYQNGSDLIQNNNVLKKLISIPHKRNEINIGDHTHKNIAVANIQEKDGSIDCTLEYREEEMTSSDLHTLLHETYTYYKGHIFEEKNESNFDQGGKKKYSNKGLQGVENHIINKTVYNDEMEYIYNAIYELKGCMQKNLNVGKSKVVTGEIFIKFILENYPTTTSVQDFFISIVEKNEDCVIHKIGINKYIIKHNYRGVIIECNGDNIDIQYFFHDRILGNQHIVATPTCLTISKYETPQETKKLQKWCDKYYLTDYITNSTRVPLDEYMLQMQKIVNERGEAHPGLDGNNAYIKYLLENCISNTIHLSEQENNISFEPLEVDSKIEQDIKSTLINPFINQLYNAYKNGLQGEKTLLYNYSNIQQQYVEKKKTMFGDALDTLGIKELSREALIDAVNNKREAFSEATLKAVSFSIKEQRAAKTVNTYMTKKSMHLNDLLQNTVLNEIVSTEEPEKTISLEKLYSLCQEYDIFSYLHSPRKEDQDAARLIQETIHTHANNVTHKINEKLNNLLPQLENKDHFFEKAPGIIYTNLGKILSGNIYEQYIYQSKILAIKASKENLLGNEKQFNIYKKKYIELIKEYQNDVEKQFQTIFKNNKAFKQQMEDAIMNGQELLKKQPIWKKIESVQEDSITIMKLDMRLIANEAIIALSKNQISLYEKKQAEYNAILKKFVHGIGESHKENITRKYENSIIKIDNRYKILFEKADIQKQKLEQIASQGGIDNELEEKKKTLLQKHQNDVEKLQKRYDQLILKVGKQKNGKKKKGVSTDKGNVIDTAISSIISTLIDNKHNKKSTALDAETLQKELEYKKDALELAYINKLEKLIKPEHILDKDVLRTELEQNKKVMQEAYEAKLYNPTITHQSIITYQTLFPKKVKRLVIPKDILYKHLSTLGEQCIEALRLLQENKVEKYDEIGVEFIKNIDLLKEDLLGLLHIEGEEIDEKVVNNIDDLLARYENIFPAGGAKKLLMHSKSMQQKYILRINIYKGLLALCDNKIKEYEKIKQEYDAAVLLLESHLKEEAKIGNVKNKISGRHENNISSTINVYRNIFPSAKLVGLSSSREYSNEEFKERIMKCEFDKLSKIAKTTILNQESDIQFESKEKSIINIINHLYTSLKRIPYIDDLYAVHCISDLPRVELPEVYNERARKYIQDHCKGVIASLIENKMVEDFLSRYIKIENMTLRDLFIKKTHQYIKSYLNYNKKDEIHRVGTYEQHLWLNVLQEKEDDEILTGSIEITIPTLYKVDTNEPIDCVFEDI